MNQKIREFCILYTYRFARMNIDILQKKESPYHSMHGVHVTKTSTTLFCMGRNAPPHRLIRCTFTCPLPIFPRLKFSHSLTKHQHRMDLLYNLGEIKHAHICIYISKGNRHLSYLMSQDAQHN